ncbi:type II toxin-antitoxin system VapC family toxin [Paenibacillus sp. FSL H3-0457]|uniref:type II toxin-antitoxin system VapC family toxin n=1 Tax=Paenibacillus sp. FSL H3-0457 TaxID=2921430 RepID=UPI0030EC256C
MFLDVFPDDETLLDFGSTNFDLPTLESCFLDTNVIIAFLYQSDNRHLSCYNFISYLIVNDIKMYISEMTVAEVINSLARALFIDDELEAYKNQHGNLPTSNRELKNLKSRFKQNWSGQIIKNDHVKLSNYNSRAIEMFAPLREICYLQNSSDQSIEVGLMLSSSVPLASSDAMIAASTILSGSAYLISLDKDMRKLSYVTVLSTSVYNKDYNAEYMIRMLGTEEFLIESLGEEEFKAKYNIAS